ncbi:MAG: class I SAM-dependent methyltransferase [Alphaproteobacteria bacterium]
MTRLDSVIRRLQAQRDAIDYAVALIDKTAGPVLELGLGNGRTYDHLRYRFPRREIYAFDRQVAAHPDCIPAQPYLFLGDLTETLVQAKSRLRVPAALAHCDVGSGDEAATRAVSIAIAPLLRPLLAPGAIVISDQPMTFKNAETLSLPETIPAARIFLWRML